MRCIDANCDSPDKNENDFYKNDRRCKDCRKRMVQQNRAERAEYYREYDRQRYDVSGSRGESNLTAERRADIRRGYRERYPDRYKANTAVSNALRDGRIVKPVRCQGCGEDGLELEAHHKDYGKPLEVTWLCIECHGDTRKIGRLKAA